MRDVWPGRPFPLGATWDGGGTNFSIFSEHAESVDLCLFDEDGEERRIQMTKRTALNWHCYVPGVSPGQRYGYRVHGPYSPHEGHRFNASKLLIDPYAKAIEGVVDWSDPRAAAAVLRRRLRGCRSRAPRPGRQRGGPEVDRDRRRVHLGGRSSARHPVLRDGHLRDSRQGVHQEPSRRPRGPARHLRRLGVRSGDRLPARAGRHGSRAAPRPSHRRRVLPVRARPQELLGLQHDRLPGPALRVRRHRPARRAGTRVQGDGQGAASRRHRGDPRRRLQPHRRGQPPGSDAVVQGRRQSLLLPVDARGPALLHGLHGHGQLAEPGPPERAAADHGLAALLGDRVPRRWLPLRPGVGARARVLRRRPPVGVLRRHPPGPGPLAGQADRRAVGRRPRRLPGGQLPGALVGVERHLPRHGPRLLARSGQRGTVRPASGGLRAICTSPTAASRSRRSTSSPLTTGSRSQISSPTTRSTTRQTSRTTATGPTTTARGTTASRVPPTIPRSTSCVHASGETS